MSGILRAFQQLVHRNLDAIVPVRRGLVLEVAFPAAAFLRGLSLSGGKGLAVRRKGDHGLVQSADA